MSDGLDDEISAALDGINLQEVATTSQEASSKRGPGGEHIYEGTIVGITGDDVIVDLGPRMQGVVSKREFEEPPAVGDKHKFTLRGREDDLWLLSMREAQDIAAWDELTEGALVKARVSGQNQGGLELKIGKHDAFMPASHAALGHVEDLSSMLGQTITCEVLEMNRQRKRVVLSRRKVLEKELDETRREATGKLAPGSVMKGKVTRVEAFGAFVDIGGGLEGLVHVSNMSRKRVEDAKAFVEVGQEVEVKLLEIKDKGKIGLGMKQLEPDPWDAVEEKFSIDSVAEGTVTRLMEFGAFIEILPGIEGLLHVSQMGRERVRRVQDAVKIGDKFSVRIQSIDRGSERISLTRLDSRGAVIGSEDSVDSSVIDDALSSSKGSIGTNLGDLFKKAMKKD